MFVFWSNFHLIFQTLAGSLIGFPLIIGMAWLAQARMHARTHARSHARRLILDRGSLAQHYDNINSVLSAVQAHMPVCMCGHVDASRKRKVYWLSVLKYLETRIYIVMAYIVMAYIVMT